MRNQLLTISALAALAVVGCKSKTPAAAADAATAATAAPPPPPPPPPLTAEEKQKVFYTLGAIIARESGAEQLDLSDAELATVTQALQDAAHKKPFETPVNDPSAKVEQLFKERMDARGAKAKAAGAAFLAKTAKEKGYQKLPSGVLVKIERPGTGPSPTADQTVAVHYRGTTVDGVEFDSSYKTNNPVTFPLRSVIPCWTQGIPKLSVGAKARLVCPPDTAYGERGAGPIAGNSTLVFDVELVQIVPAQQQAQPGAAPEAAPPPPADK